LLLAEVESTSPRGKRGLCREAIRGGCEELERTEKLSQELIRKVDTEADRRPSPGTENGFGAID
jgi:hypothetical protein